MASMRSAGLFHNTISAAGPDWQAPREDPEKIINGEKDTSGQQVRLCLFNICVLIDYQKYIIKQLGFEVPEVICSGEILDTN